MTTKNAIVLDVYVPRASGRKSEAPASHRSAGQDRRPSGTAPPHSALSARTVRVDLSKDSTTHGCSHITLPYIPSFCVGHHFLEKRILLSNWGGALRLAVSLKNMASNQELHRKPVSVVIADDHPVVLQGITEILRAQADISVVAACNGGRDATAAIQQFTPDVAVLDIIMPDLSGLDVLLSIVGDRFKTKVVLLTAVATDDRILAAMTGGAKGLLFKDAAPDILIDCVREVAKGKLWFPHGLVDAAPERESGRQAHGERSIGALTPREAQIALLVSEGLSNKLVAWQLKMAEGTVKVYLHNIFEKLGIPNRTVLCALTIPHRDWLLAAAEHARAKLN
jgi:two-component system, NarL family, nitrate/nitrite response regulator NarL